MFQLIGDTNIAQRKSWIITNSSNNTSFNGTHILDRLSSERLKRDTTPEFNSSFHYEDDNVQFDSPEPPCVISDDININTAMSMNNPSNFITNQNDNGLQSNRITTNNLPDVEPELSTSRRNTYSIDDGPMVIEQVSTPAPRHSILKGSKTAKTNRTKSNCRMVQFARLPKSDSRIKLSKSRFNSGSNFIVTNDETNVTGQDTNNISEFHVEEYDDDLAGVQPLDSSVSSLINSPILDSSNISKSSKRGSRGNKVMSLVNSIEKRYNESPKHSIRASDLLTINESKHGNVSFNNDSPNEASKLEKSSSSTRRINLENIFEIEDSLKDTTHDGENVTMIPEVDKSCVQNNETNTNTTNINDDESNTKNTLENYYNSALPSNPQPKSNSNVEDITDNLILVNSVSDKSNEVNGNHSTTETNISKFNVSFKLKQDSTLSANKHLMSPDYVENSSSVHVVNNTLNCSDIIDSHNDCSKHVEQTSGDSLTNVDKQQNNASVLVEKSAILEKDNMNIHNSNITKTVDKFNIVDENHVVVQNSVSESSKKTNVLINNSTNDEESPSMVVQCMSEMFNATVEEHDKSTCSQQDDNLINSYVLVEQNDITQSIEKNKLNKSIDNKSTDNYGTINESSDKQKINESIIDSIEKELDMVHGNNDTNSNFNEETVFAVSMTKTINDKILTSDLISNETNTANLNLEVNDNISKHNINPYLDIKSTKIINDSASMDTNVNMSCANNINSSNVSELTKMSNKKPIVLNNICSNNSTQIISDDFDNSVKEKNEVQNFVKSIQQKKSSVNKSKQLSKSCPSTMVESIINNETHSSKPIKKVLRVIHLSSESSDDDVEVIENKDKTQINEKNILDTSIGKPRYESTPWNSSKNSKTQLNSITDIQTNNTCDTSNTSKNKEQPQNNIHSISPLPDINLWSQMMKDFNESVKKASYDNSVNLINDVKKVLFDHNSSTIEDTEVEDVSSNNADFKSNMSKTENKSNIECRVTCLPNSIIETCNNIHQIGQSSINANNSIPKTIDKSTSRSKNVHSSSIAKTDINDLKSAICDVISVNKNNSVTETNNSSDIETITKNASLNVTNTNHYTINKKLILETLDSEQNKTFDDGNDSYTNDLNSSKSSHFSNKTNKKIVRTKKINSSPAISTRNLRARVNNSEPVKNGSKVKINVIEVSSTSSDSEINSLASKNLQVTSRGKMSSNKHNSKKNTQIIETNSNKTKETEKSKKIITATKTRFTRSSTSLSELGSSKLNKKNKTLSPVKTKLVKVEKTKKTKSSKLNKKKLPKRVLPSNPINTNSDSSDYEPMSETEENTSKSSLVSIPSKTNKEKIKKRNIKESPKKSQIVDVPLTRNREKNKKRDVERNPHLIDPPKTKQRNNQSDNNSSLLPSKRNQKEKIVESPPIISSPLCTRSRKRVADTPISQPNAKGPKRDTTLSKTTKTAIPHASNLSQNQSSSSKDTQNAFKLTVTQDSDNSLPETTVNKKEKSKIIVKTRGRKRELSSENSFLDSAPSAKKITRQQAAVKEETELKKSSTSTRTTSKIKVQNVDEPTSNNTKVKFEK